MAHVLTSDNHRYRRQARFIFANELIILRPPNLLSDYSFTRAISSLRNFIHLMISALPSLTSRRRRGDDQQGRGESRNGRRWRSGRRESSFFLLLIQGAGVQKLTSCTKSRGHYSIAPLECMLQKSSESMALQRGLCEAPKTKHEVNSKIYTIRLSENPRVCNHKRCSMIYSFVLKCWPVCAHR